MLSLTPLTGCTPARQNNGPAEIEGLVKEDHATWFDEEKTDLPDLAQCQKISVGMSLDEVIKKIGKPQRDIGHGTWVFQFDINDGSILTVSFVLDNNPNISTYDCLYVAEIDFDRAVPQYAYLNDLYPWINQLRETDIQKVRCEQAYIGVAPGRLKNISYSTNKVDIENTYRILFAPLQAISREEGEITGGGYVKYDFFTARNESFSVTISNKTLLIDNQYYRFMDDIYTFEFSDLDCHSFITYLDAYEIYTYADEGIKIGDYAGLGEFEFQIYEGVIEKTPSYRLKNSTLEFELLILSDDLFMIEGKNNTNVYQITGEKDFSDLFNHN